MRPVKFLTTSSPYGHPTPTHTGESTVARCEVGGMVLVVEGSRPLPFPRLEHLLR